MKPEERKDREVPDAARQCPLCGGDLLIVAMDGTDARKCGRGECPWFAVVEHPKEGA